MLRGVFFHHPVFTCTHLAWKVSSWNQLSTCSRERKGEINQHLISYKSWNQLSIDGICGTSIYMESSISINGKTQTKHFDRQTLVFFPPMMHRPLSPRPGKRHCSKKHKKEEKFGKTPEKKRNEGISYFCCRVDPVTGYKGRIIINCQKCHKS